MQVDKQNAHESPKDKQVLTENMNFMFGELTYLQNLFKTINNF